MRTLQRSVIATLLLSAAVGPIAAATAPPSLCVAGEQIAFTCPIAGSGKTVSLCLQPGGLRPPAARCAFGSTTRSELVYPSATPAPATFRSSHLGYAGASGGNAYSFANGGDKYILYSVSGPGFDRAGVLVQHVGELRASADLGCRAGTAADALKGDALARTMKWGDDPQLTQHGLPHTR